MNEKKLEKEMFEKVLGGFESIVLAICTVCQKSVPMTTSEYENGCVCAACRKNGYNSGTSRNS